MGLVKTIAACLAMGAAGDFVLAQDLGRSRFQAVHVATFSVRQGVSVPPDYLAAFVEASVAALERNGRFSYVLRPQEATPKGHALTLDLLVTITDFEKPSTLENWVTPFGADTSINAHVKFFNRATRETVAERNLTAVFTRDIWKVGREGTCVDHYEMRIKTPIAACLAGEIAGLANQI